MSAIGRGSELSIGSARALTRADRRRIEPSRRSPVEGGRPADEATERGKRLRLFAIVGTAFALCAIGYATLLGFQVGGERFGIAFNELGVVAAAFAAAGSCAWAASQARGRVRRAWLLLSASASVLFIGEIVGDFVENGSVTSAMASAASEVSYLAAVPLAMGGVLSFWVRPARRIYRWRLVLDGLIVIVALTAFGWAVGLRDVYTSLGSSLLDRVAGLAFPFGEIFVATALVLVINRGTGLFQGRLLLLLGSGAANSIAYAASTYLSTAGIQGSLMRVADVGWVSGFLMFALAAFWPVGLTDRTPSMMWQLALPWMAVVLAAIGVVVSAVRGVSLDPFLTALGPALLVLMAGSQILALKDTQAAVTDRDQSEVALAEVLTHAPAAVVTLGMDLKIIDTNQRFGAMMGIPLVERGVPLRDCFPGTDLGLMIDRLNSLKVGLAEAVEADVELHRVDGDKRWLHWSATMAPRRAGRDDYYIAMFEDSTDIHRAHEAALASLATLEKLDRIKSEFLHGASHEFKTALVGIQGYSELICESDELDPEEVRSFANDIRRDAMRLDRVITEIVEIDQAETVRTDLAMKAVDLNGIITTEVEEARRGVDGIDIVTKLGSSIPPAAGDGAKLSEVVRTLLRNAIRFSPDGGKITVSSGLSLGELIVTVRDQGMGVRADFDSRLYGQQDLYADSPIRKVVGTGLGLGVARLIVEMHGGHIWVERLDQGSEFHFTIPAITGRSGETQRTREGQPAREVAGKVA